VTAPSAAFPLVRVAEWSGVPSTVARRWVAAGLLEPLAGQPAQFPFRALATARTLAQLWRAGWTVPRLVRALAALRQVEPDLEAALAGLLEARGERQWAVRTADGSLMEPGGQRLFDFGAAGPADDRGDEPLPLRSAADWFAIGVDAETEGRLEDAERAYQRAVGPDHAEAWFNLGNCQYALRRRSQAAHAFAAAVAADPSWAEAWNNLGIVRGELGDRQGAAAALQQALHLVPHYADAHYNLAEVLAVLDDYVGARRHWQAYLAYDPNSRWAEQVRRRLRLHARR
jgi:tetratricopeptide (TPR) repeat protein